MYKIFPFIHFSLLLTGTITVYVNKSKISHVPMHLKHGWCFTYVPQAIASKQEDYVGHVRIDSDMDTSIYYGSVLVSWCAKNRHILTAPEDL